MKASFTERDFQEWFSDPSHSERTVLPGGERLLVLYNSKALDRREDLLALDRNAALCVIEVKNERTEREVVGQALEYVARYADADLGRIVGADHIAQTREQFQLVFKKPLKNLHAFRRVFVVAPNFHLPAIATQSFLAQYGKGVEFRLVRVEGDKRNGFELSYEDRKVEWISEVKGGVGMKASGTILAVLERSPRLVLWRVGRSLEGHIRLWGNGVSSKSALRGEDFPVVPLPKQLLCLDLSGSGSVWEKRNSQVRARLLGTIRKCAGCGTRDSLHVWAVFDGSRFKGFGTTFSSAVEKKWLKSSQALPPWSEIVNIQTGQA